ncbi:hypothetical protein ACWEF9_23650 [Streptomyces sp. NPDC004980]
MSSSAMVVTEGLVADVVLEPRQPLGPTPPPGRRAAHPPVVA